METGKAIYNLLDGTVGVGSRIYPMIAPQQATLPYIVYKIVSVVPHPTINKTSSVDTVTMQLDIVVDRNSYATAHTIEAAIRTALATRTQGTHGTTRTIQQIDFDGILPDQWNDEDSDHYILSVQYVAREVISSTD